MAMKSVLSNILRKRINDQNRKRLKNKEFSLISSNCNGAFICHDLGLQFRSPFVNLWMKPKDYLKYLKNIEYYKTCDLRFVENSKYNYPVGVLQDIKIFFQHYKSEKEAREKWVERSKRIDMDNLFILFTDRDGCTYEDLVEFDALPYPNKIVFTNKKYDEIKSSFCISGFEKEKSVGNCFEFISPFSGKKRYDEFDYVSWFNNET